ncbi:hypothetical protein DSO57_1009130 [Entomophthora muscae]|uniref:Uncharacterized protein n=1 Tax=Entomophthora muscae TaxID=34485 RepID=A0ACC2TUQ8_9FUNG|nr:hypothetical protein DSO57_1009130 [Entomophthora muscae]
MSHNNRASTSPSRDYGSDSVRGIKSPVTHVNWTYEHGEYEVTFTYGLSVYRLPHSLVEFICTLGCYVCNLKSKNDQQANPPHQQSNPSNDSSNNEEFNHSYALLPSGTDSLELSSTNNSYDGTADFSECFIDSSPVQTEITLNPDINCCNPLFNVEPIPSFSIDFGDVVFATLSDEEMDPLLKDSSTDDEMHSDQAQEISFQPSKRAFEEDISTKQPSDCKRSKNIEPKPSLLITLGNVVLATQSDKEIDPLLEATSTNDETIYPDVSPQNKLLDTDQAQDDHIRPSRRVFDGDEDISSKQPSDCKRSKDEK